MVTPGQGEEDEEEDEEEEDEERLASWKSLCSWLFTMLFMALCISANILCFSRFGIRPKRTAVERKRRRRMKRRCCYRSELYVNLISVTTCFCCQTDRQVCRQTGEQADR